MHFFLRRHALAFGLLCSSAVACGGASDADLECDPTDSDCSQPPGFEQTPGDETDPPPPPALKDIRVTSLSLQYDIAKPVFVNNSIPVEIGLTANSDDNDRPETRDVALYFSLVDPTEGGGCSSSATNVEIVGDGTEQRFTARIWPTKVCEEVAGEDVVVNVQVSFDQQLVEDGVDAPEVLFSAGNQNLNLNQACVGGEAIQGARGCVYPISLRPTPVDADGSNLIDVRVADFRADSSVAVLPSASNADRPALSVSAGLLVNGRDPYTSAASPDQIPAALRDAEPTIEEDLTFGLTAEQLAALETLPGQSSLRFALSASNDQQLFLPLTVATDSGTDTSLVVTELLPGVDNVYTQELFIDGEARTALEPGGQWAAESRFVVRVCYVADFVQAGNEGEDDVSDCKLIDVFLVRENPSPGVGPERNFDKSFDRGIGNRNRISLGTSFETSNLMNTAGLRSTLEGKIQIEGKFGRRFSLTLARAFAEASLLLDEDNSTYDSGVFVFERNVRSLFRRQPEVEDKDPFSIARKFDFPNLGFGFGPVRVGFKITVGGEAAFVPEFEMTSSTDPAECATLLGTTESLTRCGRIDRATGPEFSLLAEIEGGIDIFIAAAGVEAKLNLAITSFPLNAQLAYGLTDDARLLVAGGANFQLQLQLIRGEVSIVGRVGFRRFGVHLKVNLFTFESRKLTTDLLDLSLPSIEEL